MNNKHVLGVLTLLLLTSFGADAAKVYSWVDGNGITHYTDAPPPNKSAKEVDLRVAPLLLAGCPPLAARAGLTLRIVLRNLYRNLGAVSFGIMGFYDAINLSLGEPLSTQSYIAIDQGPILVMIENHRHATVWNAFMRHMDVRRGLNALGFKIYHKSIQPKS